jgi:hypothetical protein
MYPTIPAMQALGIFDQPVYPPAAYLPLLLDTVMIQRAAETFMNQMEQANPHPPPSVIVHPHRPHYPTCSHYTTCTITSSSSRSSMRTSTFTGVTPTYSHRTSTITSAVSSPSTSHAVISSSSVGGIPSSSVSTAGPQPTPSTSSSTSTASTSTTTSQGRFQDFSIEYILSQNT